MAWWGRMATCLNERVNACFVCLMRQIDGGRFFTFHQRSKNLENPACIQTEASDVDWEVTEDMKWPGNGKLNVVVRGYCWFHWKHCWFSQRQHTSRQAKRKVTCFALHLWGVSIGIRVFAAIRQWTWLGGRVSWPGSMVWVSLVSLSFVFLEFEIWEGSKMMHHVEKKHVYTGSMQIKSKALLVWFCTLAHLSVVSTATIDRLQVFCETVKQQVTFNQERHLTAARSHDQKRIILRFAKSLSDHSADRHLAITQCFCSVVFKMNHKILRRLCKLCEARGWDFRPQLRAMDSPIQAGHGSQILRVWCFLIWHLRIESKWTSWTSQASHDCCDTCNLTEGAEPCFDFQCEVARVLRASRRDGAGGFGDLNSFILIFRLQCIAWDTGKDWKSLQRKDSLPKEQWTGIITQKVKRNRQRWQQGSSPVARWNCRLLELSLQWKAEARDPSKQVLTHTHTKMI